MQNIILIGMAGVGKSTLGKILSQKLQMHFLDTDTLIQQKTGKKLQETIDEEGIESFMQIEEDVLCSVQCENTIIATGGSAIYYEKAMSHLKQNGIAIYLYTSYEELIARLSNIPTRGIVMKNGSTFKDVYEERLPLYEKYADIVINCSGKISAKENAQKILYKINSLQKN